MSDKRNFEIITFYKFCDLEQLDTLQPKLLELLTSLDIKGTILLASEGYNGTICGTPNNIDSFTQEFVSILGIDTPFEYKFFYDESCPFNKTLVKIKPEIVTMRQPNTFPQDKTGIHASPSRWNELIQDPKVTIIDTRNKYEVEMGTFPKAINPETNSFSEIVHFTENHLDPKKHKKIAMFCTGGIRCEKYSSYLLEKGFEEVYQLEGGILKYMQDTSSENSLWEGNCFIFDNRISIDPSQAKSQ